MDKPKNDLRYLNIKEASSFLGVKVGTIYAWVSRSPYGTDPIPFAKFGTRCLRFPSTDLGMWADRRRGDRKNQKQP
jgi:excisionase family DNA binding protein